MNKKCAVIISLLLLTVLSLSLVGQVFAQTYAPGVKSGDSFVYSISTQWNSSNSSATVPEYLVELNKTAWYNVTISLVSGANVTATNIWEYVNGTTGNSFVITEVENGTVYAYIEGLPAFLGFYPANQNVGDLVRPLTTDGPTINQTIMRNYAGVERETNVISFSYPVIDYYNSTGDETLTVYIDKQTGILVEQIAYTEFPDQNGTITWQLVDTNAWKFTTQPTSLLEIALIIIVVAIIIVVIALYMKKRKRQKH